MRTEEDLQDALTFLADHAPGAEAVLDRLRRERSAPAPSAGRRRIILGTLVTLLLGAVGAVVLLPRSRTLSEPAGHRVPVNWAMVSRFEPPAGWRLVTRTTAGNYELTAASDATGKGYCVVEVNRRGVQPQTPVPTSAAQPATVHDFPALYRAAPGTAAVFWPYDAKAWASLSCRLGPHGLAGASSPGVLRRLVIQLAESVTFGDYPLLLPIRLEQLPPGYTVKSATQDLSNPQNWQIALIPAQRAPTTPPILISSARNAGTLPRPNTSVGKLAASYFTDWSRGPRSDHPSSTNLCIPSARVGICLSAANTATDDPASRRQLFHTLASHISYSANPIDTTTWFTATHALPG